MAHTFRERTFSQWRHPAIEEVVDDRLGIIVIIPSFAEDHLEETMSSLASCFSPGVLVECIILINEAENIPDSHRSKNLTSFLEAKSFCTENHPSWLSFHVLFVKDIPSGIAGVGLARKLAMDEASFRFKGIQRKKGIIVNLDADCTVSRNYLSGILESFDSKPGMELLNIHYEHPLDDPESSDIVQYELHLRYFIHMQRWLKLPFAFHTIGSSFAVRNDAYQRIGGMNKRKAGEDFYFIHKFSKMGTIGETGQCTVFPSPRPSFRVPFGTGKTIARLRSEGLPLRTYHPDSFFMLSDLTKAIGLFYEKENYATVIDSFGGVLQEFLKKSESEEKIERIRSNSRSFVTFVKGFYQWFDAFRLMKFLHYSRDNGFPDIDLDQALNMTSEILNLNADPANLRGVLEEFRIRDRCSNYRGVSEVLALFPGYQ